MRMHFSERAKQKALQSFPSSSTSECSLAPCVGLAPTLCLAVRVPLSSLSFSDRVRGLVAVSSKAGPYVCRFTTNTRGIIAPRAKDLHSNNLESQDASLTAVKMSLLPFRNSHGGLDPLFKLRLIFYLNHCVTHKTFCMWQLPPSLDSQRKIY